MTTSYSSDFATAQVNFYDMAPEPEIVELHIEEKATGEAKFFLHFHPMDRDHSIQLIREMEQVLVSLTGSQRTEFLLCCTAGMTTSFFAERLNQAAEALGLDWGFSAVSVTEAYEHGQDKAAILIAPQIAYQAERVQEVMGSVPVLKIPTATFAAYDAAGCLEWVREELRARQETNQGNEAEICTCPMESKKRVLVISVHAALNEMTLHYRVYHKGTVELDRKVIKRFLKVADLTDVIDTQLCACRSDKSIDAVGIALPGALRAGRVDLRGSQVDFENGTNGLVLADYLSERYDIPVRLCNSANAAALEMVGMVLAMDCATYDPEVVALRCSLLPDMDEVAEELAMYVPREQQPELMYVDDYDECILASMLVRCLKAEKKQAQAL